jgi:hypothetical protein
MFGDFARKMVETSTAEMPATSRREVRGQLFLVGTQRGHVRRDAARISCSLLCARSFERYATMPSGSAGVIRNPEHRAGPPHLPSMLTPAVRRRSTCLTMSLPSVGTSDRRRAPSRTPH